MLPTDALTDLNILRILVEKRQGAKMAGHIRAKGKCPVCGKPFIEIQKLGFICLEHKTVPKRFYIDLPWQGQRIRVFSDKSGQALDSYDRADKLSDRIGEDLEEHIFDPSHYVTAEASKFYAENLLVGFEQDKIGNIAPSYQKDYRRMVRIAKEFFKRQDVREIRKVDIINFQKDCQKRFFWKEKTLKNNMDVFKVFMNYLKNDLEIIVKVPKFPEIDVPIPSIKWVHSEDQITLYEYVGDEDKPIIGFLMLHGCRPGEARAIKCKDVDLETRSIKCHATFSKNTYRERRKGKKSKPYIIAIHPEMVDFVSETVKGSHPEAFLFTNVHTGTAYSQEAIFRVWENVRKEGKAKGVNLMGLRLYDASRHSFASQLANQNVPTHKISWLLGHSTAKMSEKYTHRDLESLRADVTRMSLKKRPTVTRLSPRKNDDV
jgi:integrase